MLCQRCGFDNRQEAKFCERCGECLEAAEVREEDLPNTIYSEEEEKTVALGSSQPQQKPSSDQEETVAFGQENQYVNGYSYMGDEVDWGRPEGTEDFGGYREKHCQQCGALLDEDCQYCPVCGKPTFQEKKPVKNERGKLPVKAILIVLLVLFLAIDAILAGYYLYSKRASSQDDEVSETTADASSDGQTPKSGEEKSEPLPTPIDKPEIVHTYDYLIDDCSWEEAYQKCKNLGGYLVRIESAEEFETICREIKAKGMQDYMFFIGARRDPGGKSYHWIDSDNVIGGDPINDVNSPLSSYWMVNEPSFQDDAVEEICLEMNYYSAEKRWVINDVPNELTKVLPEFKGRIGYICEYELVR